MKITLLKRLAVEGSKPLAKGTTFSVTNEYAAELIQKGHAVEFGQEPTQKEDKNNNKTEE
jgi:hypothetical protein